MPLPRYLHAAVRDATSEPLTYLVALMFGVTIGAAINGFHRRPDAGLTFSVASAIAAIAFVVLGVLVEASIQHHHIESTVRQARLPDDQQIFVPEEWL